MKPFFTWLFVLCLYAVSAHPQPEWCRNLPRSAYASLERVSVTSSWFEVYRIRPGVFAIYEPHQAEEVISYLILGSKKAILFDTGLGIANIKQVAESLTKLPLSVINSHTHNDHVGDNWRFSRIYGMDTPFSRINAQGSREDAQAELEPSELCGNLPAGFDRKSYATRPFRITHTVRDGDELDLGGRILRIVATPGHTPDSIALFDVKNGLLFVGDTYYPGPIFLYRPETDLNAYERSLEKIIALKARLLLPAHNVPVADPADLLRVSAAMKQVRAGNITPVRNGSKWEYPFPGFSFLMAK
ncbi:MAG TPA: MBL fold metallo-hydrolase [Candidatus Angelobacter sp.]|nr:MBL fold metallo-hydrolase [Candidatus Angelobacter sp.]